MAKEMPDSLAEKACVCKMRSWPGEKKISAVEMSIRSGAGVEETRTATAKVAQTVKPKMRPVRHRDHAWETESHTCAEVRTMRSDEDIRRSSARPSAVVRMIRSGVFTFA